MPKKGKRGGGISAKAKGRKVKQSRTSHLHPNSSSYNPPPPDNDNTVPVESEARDQAPHKRKDNRPWNLVCNNKRLKQALKKKNTKLSEAEKRASASEVVNDANQKKAHAKAKTLEADNAKILRATEARASVANEKISASEVQE